MDKKTKICDRCGKEIKYGRFPVTKVSQVKTVSLFGFGAYDYSEQRHELCHNCTMKFGEFMSSKTPAKPA